MLRKFNQIIDKFNAISLNILLINPSSIHFNRHGRKNSVTIFMEKDFFVRIGGRVEKFLSSSNINPRLNELMTIETRTIMMSRTIVFRIIPVALSVF